jgi:hypothetical protein
MASPCSAAVAAAALSSADKRPLASGARGFSSPQLAETGCPESFEIADGADRAAKAASQSIALTKMRNIVLAAAELLRSLRRKHLRLSTMSRV